MQVKNQIPHSPLRFVDLHEPNFGTMAVCFPVSLYDTRISQGKCEGEAWQQQEEQNKRQDSSIANLFKNQSSLP